MPSPSSFCIPHPNNENIIETPNSIDKTLLILLLERFILSLRFLHLRSHKGTQLYINVIFRIIRYKFPICSLLFLRTKPVIKHLIDYNLCAPWLHIVKIRHDFFCKAVIYVLDNPIDNIS